MQLFVAESLQVCPFVLPWVAPNPQSLINWWDMQRFHAEKFCNVMSHLAGMGARLASEDFNQYIPDNVRQDVISKLLQVSETCRSIDLVVTPLQIDATVYNFKNPGNLTYLQVSQISP